MRIFIGHMAPDGEENNLKVSIAASHFSNNLLKGGFFDRAYSILPPFVKGRRSKSELQSEHFSTTYSLLRRLPGRLTLIAPVWEQIRLFFSIPRRSHVWLYNVTMLNYILVRLLEWFKPSVRVYPIVLDFTPGQPHGESILKMINRCAGRISLTNYEGISKRNFACLPGVVPPASGIIQEKKPEARRVFLLSGQLSDNIAMLPTVIKAFRRVPEAELHITGKVSDTDGIKDMIGDAGNIIYHGMISNEEYSRLLNETIMFQLSTRNPSYPENMCNFPSKIIEALLNNLAVVSTIHYPQIEGIKYFHVGSTEDGIVEGLRQILSMPDSELKNYLNQADKVRHRFSTSVWNETMTSIERPYDMVYLSNTPSFYKINLCEALTAKGKKVLLVLYGYGSEAVNRTLNNTAHNGSTTSTDYEFLHDGDSNKRNEAGVFMKLISLMRHIDTRKCFYSGWLSSEYNIYSFLSPKAKNVMICESSIYETSMTGVKGRIKRAIINRMSAILPSGIPHEEIFKRIGFKGVMHNTGSVGIFHKPGHGTFTAHTPLRFIYVGRLVDVKNLDVLIRTFNRNGLPLTIVGDGEKAQELKALAHDNIRFTGFIDNDKLGNVYQEHDVFILPSKSETWGLVVEEAIYWGLPVIVSDRVGANIDMVKNLGTGEIFEHRSTESLQNAIDRIKVNYPVYKKAVENVDFDERDRQQVDAYLKILS